MATITGSALAIQSFRKAIEQYEQDPVRIRQGIKIHPEKPINDTSYNGCYSYEVKHYDREQYKPYDTFFFIHLIPVTLIKLSKTSLSNTFTINVSKVIHETLTCKENTLKDMPAICQIKLKDGEIIPLETFNSVAFPLGGSLEQIQDGIFTSYENGFYDLDYSKTGLLGVKEALEQFRLECSGFCGYVGTKEQKYHLSIKSEIVGNKIKWIVFKYLKY